MLPPEKAFEVNADPHKSRFYLKGIPKANNNAVFSLNLNVFLSRRIHSVSGQLTNSINHLKCLIFASPLDREEDEFSVARVDLHQRSFRNEKTRQLTMTVSRYRRDIPNLTRDLASEPFIWSEQIYVFHIVRAQIIQSVLDTLR